MNRQTLLDAQHKPARGPVVLHARAAERMKAIKGLAFEPPGQVSLARWASADATADIMEFMRIYGYVGASDMKRKCSEKTFSNRKFTLIATFRGLKENNRNLRTLSQFTPRLIPAILEYWSERQGYETQVQNFSVLTWFWRMHGIKVQPIKHYIDDEQERSKFSRVSVATVDKSWSGNDVDVDLIIKRAAEIDPVVARLLELARSFGMRMRETLRSVPHEDDKGDHLSLTKGTKTGRSREINYDDFDGDAMRKAIEAVKDQLSPSDHAAWKGRTLKQARNRLYYVLDQLGITKGQLGVTFHGLRAQWAIQEFERITGAKAPVRGGGSVNYAKFADTRRTIARALGHNRISVTSAYYGSFFRMNRIAEDRFRQSWKLLEPVLPELRDVLDNHGIGNLWMVGQRANGANSQLAAPFEFLIDEAAHSGSAVKAAAVIAGLVEDRLMIQASVHIAVSASPRLKQTWVDNALPLYEVEPPKLTGLADEADDQLSSRDPCSDGGTPGSGR